MIMNVKRSEEVFRELTAAELEQVTGGFLGSLIRKTGRSIGPVVQSPRPLGHG